jgi:hypothetical protein
MSESMIILPSVVSPATFSTWLPHNLRGLFGPVLIPAMTRIEVHPTPWTRWKQRDPGHKYLDSDILLREADAKTV